MIASLCIYSKYDESHVRAKVLFKGREGPESEQDGRGCDVYVQNLRNQPQLKYTIGLVFNSKYQIMPKTISIYWLKQYEIVQKKSI